MKGINAYLNYYFVGIGGIGMSALARYFKSRGKRVAGYDHMTTKLTRELEKEGFPINFKDLLTEEETDLKPEDTLVVYTPAIHELGILDYFRKGNFTIVKRSVALGMVTADSKCIAIAGTHGKTTTTTLVAHLCKEAGISFSGFLGGISENYQSNFIENGHEFSVVEADEFDRSFLHLHPDYAVVTSMDADHLDIYGDKAHVVQSFREFASLVPEDENLFVRKGLDPGRKSRSYAVNEKAEFYSDNIEVKRHEIYFDFHEPATGERHRFLWNIQGVHNVENATAALAVLRKLGASFEDLKRGMRTFKGIKRRYTKHFFASGKMYIDDYGHHPQELNAVLDSIRAFYPDKKLLVVFQPHLYSRTRDFADGFARSLEKADELILLDIYPARELPIEGVTSEWLLDKVRLPLDKKETSSLAKAMEKIKQKKFDILLTIGAGTVDTLSDPIVAWLGKEVEEK